MSTLVKRVLAVVAGIGLVALLIWAFTAGRQEQVAERAREAPVASPSRVQPVGGVAGIVLDSATERRLGIVTQPVTTSAQAGTVTLTGALAEDPSQTTTIRAPLAGRLLLPERASWPTVGQRVAPGQPLGQVSDARPLVAPRGGTVTTVGAQPGELVQPGQALLTLVNFDRLLARIVWRPDAPRTPPRALTIAPLGAASGGGGGVPGAGSPAAGQTSEPGVRAALVGPDVAVDTLTRAPVFLYRLEHAWLGARPGLPVVALLPDRRSRVDGILIPTNAAVQWNALVWVYVQRGPGRYVRVRVDTSTPVADGWLAPPRAAGQAADPSAGLAVGDRLVVRGAEQLLSEEFRSSTAPMGEGAT